MGKKLKQLAARGKKAASRVYHKAETEVLAAIGRRAVRAKGREAARVGKQVGKAVAGEMARRVAIAGAIAATGAIIGAARKGKRRD